MFRRNHLTGCCAACFGLGLMVGRGLESGLLATCIGIGLLAGYCIESWLVCTCGGIALVFFGVVTLKQK